MVIGSLTLNMNDVIKSVLRKYDPQASIRIIGYHGEPAFECMLVWPLSESMSPVIDEVRKIVSDIEITCFEPIIKEDLNE